MPLKFPPWGPSPECGLYGGGGGALMVEARSGLGSSAVLLSQGDSQLLAMPSCYWNLDMSSLSLSAVLTLRKTVPHCPWRGKAAGRAGEQGSCLGHLGLWSLPVSMESLNLRLACVWCLSVLGQGQGTQLLGLWQRPSWSGVRSRGALCQCQSCFWALR